MKLSLEEFVERGRKAQESVDAILSTCVRCGHSREDHYKSRGACKHKKRCLCSRYVGR